MGLVQSITGLATSMALIAGAYACPHGDKPITVVVPYPAGGSMDVVTRLLADAATAASGRTFLVRNIGGASGTLATRQVLAWAHDGCSVLAGNVNTLVLGPLLNPHAGYVTKDFVPIGKVGRTDFVVVTHAALPAKNVADLAQLARTLTRPLAAGHPGNETLQFLELSAIQRRLALPLVKVPYRGSSQLVNELMGQHLDFAVVAKPVATPLVERGQLRELADDGKATSAARDPAADLIEGWAGWFVASGTPPASIRWIRAALDHALRDPRVRRELVELGSELPSEAEQARFDAEVESDVAKYRRLLGATPASNPAGPR